MSERIKLEFRVIKNIYNPIYIVHITDKLNFLDTYYISEYKGISKDNTSKLFYWLTSEFYAFKRYEFKTVDECFSHIRAQYSSDNFEFIN